MTSGVEAQPSCGLALSDLDRAGIVAGIVVGRGPLRSPTTSLVELCDCFSAA